VIAKRKGVSARRRLKEAWKQRREPMNKNRIEAYGVGRVSRYNEVHIHQGHRWVNSAVVR